MGDKNFMGGLLGGMAQGMEKQQERGLKESLAKAQLDLIKAQSKHEEQKVKTALTMDQLKQQYMGSGAGSGGQAGGQEQPGGFPGLNSDYAKQNMIYRAITDGGSLPAPNMRPSVTRLPDGTILTTLNGQVVSAIPGPVENERVMGTGPGGEPRAYQIPKTFSGGGLGAQPPQLGGTAIQIGPRPTENVKVADETGEYTVPMFKQGMSGDMPLKTKPAQGETAGESGKMQAIIGGLQDGQGFLKQLMKPDGSINDKLIMQMSVPYTLGIGQGRGALGAYRNAVDAIVRQRTGAAIREDEWPYYDSIYKPTLLDPGNVKLDKANRLNRDLQGALNQADPTKVKQTKSTNQPKQNMQAGYNSRLQRVQAMPEGPAKQQALQILQGWAKENLVR